MAANKIKAALGLQDLTAQFNTCVSLAKELFAAQNVQESKEFLLQLLQSDLPVPSVRQILSGVVDLMHSLSNNSMLDLGIYCLELISPRSSSFEEEELKIRDHIYDVFCARKDYLSAARILSAINFEGFSRSLTNDSKSDKYIKIAECYLEIG